MSLQFSVKRGFVRCALFGHKVRHTRIEGGNGAACVRCGAAILDLGNGVSRVAHTLSCFFGSHHYAQLATREAHREYLCERCGHPLLLRTTNSPPAGGTFRKRVSYGCGILGHRVHVVKAGSKSTEYACLCGHSFVKTKAALTVIRHPVACVMLGHLVGLNEIRGGWAEYVCRRCGHPFCFALSSPGRRAG